jgi:hypothetical protein
VTGTGGPGPPFRRPDRRASRLRCVRAGRRSSRGSDAGGAGCGTCVSVDASRARSASASGPIAVATDDTGGTRRDLHRSDRWTKHNKRTKTNPQRHASPSQGRRHDVLLSNQAGITSGDLRESGKSGGVRIPVAILGIVRCKRPYEPQICGRYLCFRSPRRAPRALRCGSRQCCSCTPLACRP